MCRDTPASTTFRGAKEQPLSIRASEKELINSQEEKGMC